MAFDLNLGGLIPQSAFVNDTAVATAQGESAANIAYINAQAAQYAADQQAQTMQYIIIAVVIIALLFIIFWFLKN